MNQGKQRLVIGITGASGAVLGIELLHALKQHPTYETHLVISEGARRTILDETEITPQEVISLADVCHDFDDIGAAISSGSFRTCGMIVIPCSMKTVAGIATGYSDNLILRAADVTLKERRKLVLVPREAPLSPIHLRNMLALSELGAMILPPMLTFYSGALSSEDMVRHVVGKILDQFEINHTGFRRWKDGDPT